MELNSPAQRVAAEVRAAMARNRVSQEAVARALGVSQTAVSRRLSGVVPFDINELECVAQFLGVPIQQLVYRAGGASLAEAVS